MAQNDPWQFKCDPPGGGLPKPKSEFSKDELLWLARSADENDHRYSLQLWDVERGPYFSMQHFVQNPNAKVDCILREQSWNKTVPMYFFSSLASCVVAQVMQNYIYRRWFRPYRSEIGSRQFVCNFITPEEFGGHTGPPTEGMINTLTAFNRILCAQSQADLDTVTDESSRLVQGYYLRPLYKALVAIVCCSDYNLEDSKTVGRFPVYLVRTGIEEGLSAPISFTPQADTNRMESISGNVVRTNLETAVDFIMALEAREAAAFGTFPDPAWLRRIPKDKDGNELTKLPGSQWVSEERAAEWGWCGKGREWAEYWEPRREKSAIFDYKVALLQQEALRQGKKMPDTVTLDGFEGLAAYFGGPGFIKVGNDDRETLDIAELEPKKPMEDCRGGNPQGNKKRSGRRRKKAV